MAGRSVVSTLETRFPTQAGGGRRISHIIGGSPPATREQATTPPFWRDTMVELTFVYDDSTLTLHVEDKPFAIEIVVDAMHDKGWTIQQD